MSKVIQIRDVPDGVHAALTGAATELGLSLTSYLNAELARLAEQPAIVRRNTEVVRRVQRQVGARVDRGQILSALRAERGEE